MNIREFKEIFLGCKSLSQEAKEYTHELGYSFFYDTTLNPRPNWFSANGMAKRITHGKIFHNVDSTINDRLFDGTIKKKNQYVALEGGIIVFPTDVKSDRLKDIVDWFKNNGDAFFDKTCENKKTKKAFDKALFGYSLGNFYRSQYKTDETIFDKDSPAIEVIGVNVRQFIKLAVELCNYLNIESALLKDGHIGFGSFFVISQK